MQDDVFNKSKASIRSKDTYFCMSEHGDKCLHDLADVNFFRQNQEFAPSLHKHPCHEKLLHHHCHSDHSMKSLVEGGALGIHYCESVHENDCKEQCKSCLEECHSCALDVSFGGKRKLTDPTEAQ